MDDKVRALLSLETSEARRSWLEQNAPVKDGALLSALRDEAERCRLDDPHTARSLAEAVADAAHVWGDPETRAVGMHIEAYVCMALDQHQAALELYEGAAALYRSLGMGLEAAHVAVGKLATMMYLGAYENGLALAEWACTAFRAAGDQLALGKTTMNQGSILARLGRFDEARARYAEARGILASIGDSSLLAMLNVNDANVLTELDDFRQAGRLFEQARAHFEAEEMASAVAQVDQNLGYLYFAQGDYQQALATFNRARQEYLNLGSRSEVAYVDLHRSDVYLALNLWQEAVQRAREARPVFEAAEMAWETGRLWLNEAVAMARTDGGPARIDALNRARVVFEQQHNALWLATVDLYQATFDWRRGQVIPAQEAALRARAVFEREGLRSRAAQCEIVLGEIRLAKGDAKGAADHFARGLAVLEGADVPAVAYACRYGLARTEQAMGRAERALFHYRQAVEDVERLQAAIGAEDYKIGFLSDKLRVYEGLVLQSLDLRTEEGVREAFETVERAKSRALLDALAGEPPAPSSSPTETELTQQMDRLKTELNWYYTRLNEPRAEEDGQPAQRLPELIDAITSRETELRQLLDRWRSPDLATAPSNPVWTVTPEQVQAVLPNGMTLLEFYTAGEEVIAFGLTQDRLWTHRLPGSSAEISDALAEMRFQISKFSYDESYRARHAEVLRQGMDDALGRLYDSLLSPIAAQLEGDTLVVVPHGVLHYVPFQALYDGDRYLIDHKTVSYAPSATILHRALTRATPTNGRQPLMLGLCDETIPYARREVELISEVFPDADVRLGDRATVEGLMENESQPAFLHLSTHATFRADNPLFSAVKLADGWVSVNDIYGMAGSAPLVVLSACETGRSQVTAGDELVGLCRGFFRAGARSLVLSLWMVDDTATADLMGRFYEELQAGQPVNRALRAAQLEIKSRLGHPYYWAPFVMTGDTRTRLRPSVTRAAAAGQSRSRRAAGRIAAPAGATRGGTREVVESPVLAF